MVDEIKIFDYLISRLNFDLKTPSTIIGDLDLSELKLDIGDKKLDFKLKLLPESIGFLTVKGNVDLSNNKLVALPENFGNLEIGGALFLSGNGLVALPENFYKLGKINGVLDLSDNLLASLPTNFSLTVTEDLYLAHNYLTSLPENCGNLKVGGNLYLNNNFLPMSSICLAHVEGNIYNEDLVEDEKCAICLRVISDDQVQVIPQCGHVEFHHTCLSKWQEKNKSCPICRSDF